MNEIVDRKWGKYEVIKELVLNSSPYRLIAVDPHRIVNNKIKILTIDPGKAISLQYHEHRSEIWIVLQASGVYVLNGDVNILDYNNILIIKKTDVHNIRNNASIPLIILEIQTGTIVDEEDIIRLQ